MSSCAYVVLLVIAAGVMDCAKAEEPFALPIIGGETSPVNEFPFLVSLSRDGGSRWNSFCGGSIINESFILTAAHCKRDIPIAQIQVVAGLYDLTKKDPRQARSVSDFIIHPRYNGGSVHGPYDIAVVRLNSPLTLKAREVEKATLNTDDACPSTGASCTVTGWGRIDLGPLSTSSDVRKKCNLSVYSLENCRETYVNESRIKVTAGSVCAGTSAGGTSACHGDSGGPLISQCGGGQAVVGIVSCGDPNTCSSLPNQPGVYTRVSFFQKWIATGDLSEVITSGSLSAYGLSGMNWGFDLLLIFGLLASKIF